MFGQDVMFLQPINVAEIHPWTSRFVMRLRECIMKNSNTYARLPPCQPTYLHRRGGREFSYTAVSLHTHNHNFKGTRASWHHHPPASPHSSPRLPTHLNRLDLRCVSVCESKPRSLRCSGSHGLIPLRLIELITAAGAAFF